MNKITSNKLPAPR